MQGNEEKKEAGNDTGLRKMQVIAWGKADRPQKIGESRKRETRWRTRSIGEPREAPAGTASRGPSASYRCFT